MSHPVTARIAALAILVVVALAAGIEANATAPGKNGQIVFRRYLRGTAQGHPAQPPNSEAALFVANPDGTGERQLTQPPRYGVDSHPDVAPDGSTVVFTRQVKGAVRHAWVVNIDGSGAHRIDPKCPKVGCFHNDGAGPPAEGAWPVYSPDGKSIALTHYWGRVNPNFDELQHAEIAVMHADGTGMRRLTKFPDYSGDAIEPTWSPDGKRIVFVQQPVRPRKTSAVFVVNANGSGLHQLTPYKARFGDRPDWSPDGKLILMRQIPRGLSCGGNYYTIRPNGSGLHQLTHFGPGATLCSARWSPDGQSIVFADAPAGGNPDIYTMRADGSGITPVTNTPLWESTPTWAAAH